MNKKHQKIRLLLRMIAILLLVGGLTLSIIGFLHFGNFDSNLFLLTMLGLPCLGCGIGLLFFSFGQSISRFIKNEQAPIVNELSKDISPAIQNYASAVKDELFNKDEIVCSCGNRNQKDDKFCSECGKALQSVCPTCGKVVEADDKFCPACGQKLN